MQIILFCIMEKASFEFLSGVALQNNNSLSPGHPALLSVMPYKKPSLWLKRALLAKELGCVWSGHPPRVTNSPLQSACENKAGQRWGSNQSCAVTLSGMLMSLQVTGGQWAPHGPTPSPLAPCISLSVHTHKETPLAHSHISNVLPVGKRTGSPLTGMFYPV